MDLSHLDLLYASPVTGELLLAEAEADPVEDGWKAGLGERYIVADTLGWVERVPTYKEQLRELKERNLATYGFLGYPVLQAAETARR